MTKGNFITTTKPEEYIASVQKVIDEASENDSELFFGLILCGLKIVDKQITEEKIRSMLKTKWKLIAGFDFIMEEDKFPPLK